MSTTHPTPLLPSGHYRIGTPPLAAPGPSRPRACAYTKETPVPPKNRPAAITALARGATYDQAATESGISARTLRRWLAEDPAFVAEVAEVRTTLLDSAVGSITAAAGEAVETLRGALTDPDGRNRVQAARVLLDALLPLRESLELEQRLSALEAAEQDKGHR